MNNRYHKKPFQIWLELLRLPNLFTVPGDSLSGFFLAFSLFQATSDPTPLYSFIGLPLIMTAGLLFYCFGLILNDLADFDKDRVYRPERPLPSGRIRPDQAVHAAIFCAATGLLLSGLCSTTTFFIAILLTLLIVIYNLSAKHAVIPGALVMGLCRGTNIILGASLVKTVNIYPLIFLFLFEFSYIFLVTIIARHENKSTKFGFLAWLPGCCIFLFQMIFATLVFTGQLDSWLPGTVLAAAVAALFLFHSILIAGNLVKSGKPEVTRHSVSLLIRNLILLQCFMLFLCGIYGIIAGIILLPGLLPSTVLGKNYQGS